MKILLYEAMPLGAVMMMVVEEVVVVVVVVVGGVECSEGTRERVSLLSYLATCAGGGLFVILLFLLPLLLPPLRTSLYSLVPQSISYSPSLCPSSSLSRQFAIVECNSTAMSPRSGSSDDSGWSSSSSSWWFGFWLKAVAIVEENARAGTVAC